MHSANARNICRMAGRWSVWIVAAALFWRVCHAQAIPEVPNHTIASNLRLRFSRGDLGDVLPAPQESRRAVRIAQGGDLLLSACKEHPETWSRDPLIGRLAHRDAWSTIGCRERSSPGLHVVFYRTPEGEREAWAHFDLHGPENTVLHLSEVVRNRLTFGRTSEFDVYRGLLRQDSDADSIAPRYDFNEHAREYLRSTFGPQTLGAGVVSAIASTTFRNISGIGVENGGYPNRIAFNLATNTIAKSIEFGTAAFLQQEQGFSASGERGFRKRSAYALYRTFMVPGRDGDELAFPRIAAAAGTAWMIHRWHPWQEAQPNVLTLAGWILARYALRSYWTEFKPEILHVTRKMLRRHDFALPLAAPPSPPVDIQAVNVSP